LFAFIEVTTSALTMLALSSLSNSSRYVGILYTALIFFTSALWGVLTFALGRQRAPAGHGWPGVSWISPSADLTQVGNAIFRLPPRYDTAWPIALLVLALLIAGSVLILERRVRGVEVVA